MTASFHKSKVMLRLASEMGKIPPKLN